MPYSKCYRQVRSLNFGRLSATLSVENSARLLTGTTQAWLNAQYGTVSGSLLMMKDFLLTRVGGMGYE